MKPELFIGSSRESIHVVNALTEVLEFDFNVNPWFNGIFDIGSTTLDDLLNAVNKSDFGIFVFSDDDVSLIRKKTYTVARDNVLFELGMYLGKLGKANCFILMPSNTSDEFHMPTDLIGFSVGNYDNGRANLPAALNAFCSKLKRQIFDQSEFNLTGVWHQEWSVQSEDFPETDVDENAEIFSYKDKLKGSFKASDGKAYLMDGHISNRHVTGTWINKFGGPGYNGAFQLVINPSGDAMEGTWIGWSKNETVKSGKFSWKKVK
jgi:hypothetical protein